MHANSVFSVQHDVCSALYVLKLLPYCTLLVERGSAHTGDPQRKRVAAHLLQVTAHERCKMSADAQSSSDASPFRVPLGNTCMHAASRRCSPVSTTLPCIE